MIEPESRNSVFKSENIETFDLNSLCYLKTVIRSQIERQDEK